MQNRRHDGSNSKLAAPADTRTHAVHNCSYSRHPVPRTERPIFHVPITEAGLRPPLLGTAHRTGPGGVCWLPFRRELDYWCVRCTCMRSRGGGSLSTTAGTCEQGAARRAGGGGGQRRARRGLAVAEVRVRVPCTLARVHDTSRPGVSVHGATCAKQPERRAAVSICAAALRRIGRPAGWDAFALLPLSQNMCLCGNSGRKTCILL